MAKPRFMFNGDPEAPVIEGTHLADTRNIPPAEQQRLKPRSRAVHDVLMAALRWAKHFDEYDQVLCKSARTDWGACERQALDYGAACADLRDAVRAYDEVARG